MKHPKKLIISTFVFSFLIGGIGYFITHPRTIVEQAEWSFDIENKENITNFAKQVFVGKVIKREGSKKNENDDVYTYYKVQVEEVLKGDLEKGQEITVEQHMGYNKTQLAIVKMHEDDEYLEEDASYTLATSNEGTPDTYTIVTPAKGNVKIKGKKDKKRNEKIVDEFKEGVQKNKE